MDRIRIGQVILNLVRNAVEAMQGAPVRRLSISTRSPPGTHGVEIEIADTGHGISAEVAERLFQPFGTSKASGMGIGLSICREIVEAHRGTISATANDAGGNVSCGASHPDRRRTERRALKVAGRARGVALRGRRSVVSGSSGEVHHRDGTSYPDRALRASGASWGLLSFARNRDDLPQHGHVRGQSIDG
jgi:hypothetical protein